MNRPYAPRTGSLVERVIEQLTITGGSLNAAEISEQFDFNISAVASTLAKAVHGGLLQRHAEGRAHSWSLPNSHATPAAAVAPRKAAAARADALEITIWHDGDVIVYGLTLNDDGSITLTPAQIRQLVERVALPLVRIN